MPGVRIPAYAKLNWTLEVGPLRPDGYHEVHTALQRLALHDRLHLTLRAGAPPEGAVAPGGLAVTLGAPPDLPPGADNLACRAALALAAAVDPGALPRGTLHIRLEKAIPVAAGLAGGSADAAAVLRGLAGLCAPPPAFAVLEEAARGLGADVPFCLGAADPGGPGLALGTGRGERLAWRRGSRFWLVVCVPPAQVPTAEAYALWDAGRGRVAPPGPPGAASARAIAAAAAGDRAALSGALFNALEGPVAAARPEVAAARAALEGAGAAGVGMSGSGPTVFALADSEAHAREVAGRAAERLPRARVLVTEAF